MKSESFPPKLRSLSYVFCRSMNSSVSVELDPSERIFTVLPPATVIAGGNREKRISGDLHRLNVFPIEKGASSAGTTGRHSRLWLSDFIDRYAQKAGKSIHGVSKKSLNLLQSYQQPGNIRELQNVIERSIIVCDTENFSVDESWLSRQSVASEPKGHLELSRKLAAQEKEMIEAAQCANPVDGCPGTIRRRS